MGYDTTFQRLPITAWFDLKGPKDALCDWIGLGVVPEFPTTPNRMNRADGAWLGLIGPKHWILQDAIEREEPLCEAMRLGDVPAEISIVLISDTLATFRIEGGDAAHVVAIGCPLDLHRSYFPYDAVSYSEFFGQKALVWRCESGFHVSVEQSFGPMIEDYLSRALR